MVSGGTALHKPDILHQNGTSGIPVLHVGSEDGDKALDDNNEHTMRYSTFEMDHFLDCGW